MKLYFKTNVHGWIMTGILGKDAKWFFGYSRKPTNAEELLFEFKGI